MMQQIQDITDKKRRNEMKDLLIFLMVLLCSIPARADNAFTRNKKKFEVTAEKGASFVAVGRMMPKELWKEHQKLISALKKARLAEQSARKRLKDLLDMAPEKEIDLLNKFSSIDGNLKNIGKKVDSLNGDVKGTIEDFNKLKKMTMGIIIQIANILDEIDNIWDELVKKKSRDEGWAFGISFYGSAEYATNKEDFMPVGGLALMANWHRKNKTMELMLGAGVSVINGASLSWTFIPSLLFDLSSKLAIGPALIITQDLGDLEGADRMIYSAGVKVKTSVFGLNAWAIPSLGLHLERGYHESGPTDSFNAGLTAGVDSMFLQ